MLCCVWPSPVHYTVYHWFCCCCLAFCLLKENRGFIVSSLGYSLSIWLAVTNSYVVCVCVQWHQLQLCCRLSRSFVCVLCQPVKWTFVCVCVCCEYIQLSLHLVDFCKMSYRFYIQCWCSLRVGISSFNNVLHIMFDYITYFVITESRYTCSYCSA